jgi:hypothetical protein
VTGVRAQWTEPSVHGLARSGEVIWVGIGGWGQAPNIIQVGTFAHFSRVGGAFPVHTSTEGFWYELVPADPQVLFQSGFIASPGDKIYASLIRLPGARDKWRIWISDPAIGGDTFTTTVRFHSLEAYPAFIVEDPNRVRAGRVGPFIPFAHWGPVTFANLQVRVASRWLPAAMLPGYRINMTRNGQVLATAGALSKTSGFTATQR